MIPVVEETVVSADAYLLFYQKSSLKTSTTAVTAEPRANHSVSSISSGYVSSVNGSNFNLNHWAFQMPPFNYYHSNVNGFNSNGNDRSSTLPNRRILQHAIHNRIDHSSQNIHSNHQTMSHNTNSINRNNERLLAHETTSKHSTGNTHILQLDGHPNAATTTTTNGMRGSHYSNNTFPRIKSRQTSH